jgi:hypothetical protein
LKNIPHLNKGEAWTPHQGKWKVTKLPRDAGTKPEMTQADYDKKHSDK